MAKQCIYCGRPLAKDDARFCNDCGLSQVAPISTASGAVAPSAIKVKLPPKEYTRDDLSSVPQETSLPGPAAGSPPVFPSPREQIASPSARLPKRPTRLKPQASSVSVEKAPPASTPRAAEVRPSDTVSASQPTPAEEASTMVLPNWREELAQLRKEQEQTRADTTVVAEKKTERAAAEPPPLPRRSAGTFPPSSIASPSRGPNTPLPPSVPNTPQPQNNARPGLNTPLPPSEKKHPTEASWRELHVKVWEPEATVRSSPTQEEKPEPGPAPAVAQNPFASAAFDAEEQRREDEELGSVTWRAPRDPLSASRKQQPAKEEQRPLAREEIQQSAKEEQHALAEEEHQEVWEEPHRSGEEHQPVREEKHQEVWEEPHRSEEDERGQQAIAGDNEGIEDLPTVPLAVPEMANQEPSIKVERASTPAPRKWAAPRTGNVEDLPTQPMTASSSASTVSHSPQQPSIAQTQSGVERLNADQVESALPFGPRVANPPSLSGAYGRAPVAQAAGQTAETNNDPLASRARPTRSTVQTGPTFDPVSMPPLPPGPLPASENTWQRADVSGPQGPQPRSAAPSSPDAPGQRPPSFTSSPTPASVPANASKPTADASAVQGKKPRKQRHTGRLIVIIVLVLVLVGGGVGVAFNRDWVMQYFQTPAQNQPYQTYQNSALGVSLAYTQGWSVNVDQAQSAVHFADSSRTGQANLTRATANGQVSDYLNQQTTHLGMTGPKTAPAVTIGGVNWQVVQGTIVLSGATYTGVLYATQHNGQIYMLEFLAPQSSFTHIDQSDFAHMRSSFKFL